jgi:hypothetical protein
VKSARFRSPKAACFLSYVKKCHKETSYVAIKQAKMSFLFSFTKSENRRTEQGLPGAGKWYQWEGGGGTGEQW